MENELYTQFMMWVKAIIENNAITKEKIFELTKDMIVAKRLGMLEKDLINGPLGMVASQIRMEEPIPKDFTLKFYFEKTPTVERSKGHLVTIPLPFERTDLPKSVNIHIPLQESLQFLTEVRASIQNDRLYYENLKKMFHHINTLIEFSLDYLTRERNTNLLEYILRCSKNIFTFEMRPRFHSKVTWAREQNKRVPKHLFVLDKKSSVDEISESFEDLLSRLRYGMDITTVLGEVQFTLSNCPSPGAIILMSKNYYYFKLVKECKHRTEHRTSLEQVITTMTPSQVQINQPKSVSLYRVVSHNYTKNSNTPIKSSECVDLHYLMVNPHVQAIVVPLDENSKNRKPSLVCFDYMVPTGVRLQGNCRNNVPAYQMKTYFKTSGVTQTLSLADIKPFIQNLFKSRRTLELNESVVPHALYDKCPDGFSCDNDLIGKTFMFYHYRNDENTRSPEAKKRKNSSSSVTVCNTLHQNKYVLQNHYMSRELIVSNIVNLLHSREHILERFKNEIQVKNFWNREDVLEPNRVRREDSSTADVNEDGPDDTDEDAEENRLRTRDLPITERQRNKYIVNHVSNDAFKGQKHFVKKLVETVCVGDIKRMYTRDDVAEVALFVLTVQNKHLALFDGELLKFINPGFGVLWIKPVIVDTDPIIVCRPDAYGNVTGGVESRLNEISNNPLCTLEQKSIPFRNSIECGSIAVPYANIYQWISNATNIAIDPTNKEQADGALNRIKALKNFPRCFDTQLTEQFDGWWPVICPPDLNKAMFDSANTPVGRLATHYSSKEEFSEEFNNKSKQDIKFTRVFTANLVFSDVYTNINMLILYPPDVINDPDCPLNKYLTYNDLAASSFRAIRTDPGTVEQNETYSATTHDPAGQNIELGKEHLVSKLIGSALPKTCWSKPGLYHKVKADTTGFYKNEEVIIEEESFLIKGIDAFQNL